MRDRAPRLEMEPPQPLPPWLIEEIERERAVEAERPALNIDGELSREPMTREGATRDDESAEKAPSSVVIIPL